MLPHEALCRIRFCSRSPYVSRKKNSVSGLDPGQAIEVRQLIKALGGKHTIVLSTHILPEVTAICEKALIISQGKVVAYDTLENLQRAHAGAATADGQTGPVPSLEEIFLKLTSV